MRLFFLLLLLPSLAACNSTSGSFTIDRATGKVTGGSFSSWNLASERALALKGPGGFTLDYASNADGALAAKLADKVPSVAELRGLMLEAREPADPPKAAPASVAPVPAPVLPALPPPPAGQAQAFLP